MSPVARSISALFSPALTSSRNSSFGFIASAFANSSRLRIASVSVAAGCMACASNPTKVKCARLVAGGFDTLAGLREQCRRRHVVERGEFSEWLHDLEGPCQPETRGLKCLDPGDVTAIEGDSAGIGG